MGTAGGGEGRLPFGLDAGGATEFDEASRVARRTSRTLLINFHLSGRAMVLCRH